VNYFIDIPPIVSKGNPSESVGSSEQICVPPTLCTKTAKQDLKRKSLYLNSTSYSEKMKAIVKPERS